MKLKNLKTIIAVSIIGLVFVFSMSSQVAAISVMELLGLEKKQPEVEKTETIPDSKIKNKTVTEDKSDWAKTEDSNSQQYQQIDLDYVTLLVANMNEQERTKILEEPELFRQVIENEANNISVISAAIKNKVNNDRNVEFLMRRSAENILNEAYLNRLIASKLPKDFPTESQIQEYYDANKAQFVIPERIHVWQIFFKKPENADEKALSELKKKANKVISDINKRKKDFSSLAIALSEHEQSQSLGGYMGLLKVDDLLPEMKESLLKLKEGEISRLVESATGFHILKRGKIIKAETLELAKVKSQISQLLVKQANLQLRQAIFAQANKEYPQGLSEKKIEEWRLRLKTNTQ